jgi:uncharacterized membrane protein YhaH (DUF805 family)
MFKALWGEVRDGRLVRLPFLGYSVLLNVLLIVCIVVLLMASGVGEELVSSDMQNAETLLSEQMSMPMLLLFALLVGAFLFASLNIMAKRFRDIGLPGWWATFALVAVGGLVSAMLSEQVGSGLHTLVWVALLLIPTAAVANKGLQA